MQSYIPTGYYSQNFLLKYKSNLWLADRWGVIFIFPKNRIIQERKDLSKMTNKINLQELADIEIQRNKTLAQHAVLTNSNITRQYQREEKKIDDKWDIEDASDHKDFVDEEERNDENDFLQIEINNNNTLEQEEIRQENNDEYKRIHEQDDYDER